MSVARNVAIDWFQALLKAIGSRLKRTVDEELFIPMFPKQCVFFLFFVEFLPASLIGAFSKAILGVCSLFAAGKQDIR